MSIRAFVNSLRAIYKNEGVIFSYKDLYKQIKNLKDDFTIEKVNKHFLQVSFNAVNNNYTSRNGACLNIIVSCEIFKEDLTAIIYDYNHGITYTNNDRYEDENYYHDNTFLNFHISNYNSTDVQQHTATHVDSYCIDQLPKILTERDYTSICLGEDNINIFNGCIATGDIQSLLLIVKSIVNYV